MGNFQHKGGKPGGAKSSTNQCTVWYSEFQTLHMDKFDVTSDDSKSDDDVHAATNNTDEPACGGDSQPEQPKWQGLRSQWQRMSGYFRSKAYSSCSVVVDSDETESARTDGAGRYDKFTDDSAMAADKNSEGPHINTLTIEVPKDRPARNAVNSTTPFDETDRGAGVTEEAQMEWIFAVQASPDISNNCATIHGKFSTLEHTRDTVDYTNSK